MDSEDDRRGRSRSLNRSSSLQDSRSLSRQRSCSRSLSTRAAGTSFPNPFSLHRLRRDESLSEDSDMGPNVSDIQESLRQIETAQSENENLHAEIHILTAENANLRERLEAAESREKAALHS